MGWKGTLLLVSCMVLLLVALHAHALESETKLEAEQEQNTQEQYDVDKLIRFITKGVRKGMIKTKGKSTIMANNNELVQRETDHSIDPEEALKKTQEEGRKAEREDKSKQKDEDLQKKVEQNTKHNVKEQKARSKEEENKIIDEQEAKTVGEEKSKRAEVGNKKAEEQRNKDTVKSALEKAEQDKRQAMQELAKKQDEEDAQKKALEQATKREIDEGKQKAAQARAKAQEALQKRQAAEQQEKAQIRAREAQEKEAARKREQSEKERRKSALGHWCACTTVQTNFGGHNTWASCPDGHLMMGMYRADEQFLRSIQHLYCCRPCQEDGRTQLAVTQCSQADWVRSFDYAGWSTCPGNTYMQGLYKSTCEWIYCIEYAKCCAIAGSRGRQSCEAKSSWGLSFDRRGWSTTDQNKFMAGLYRSGGHYLYNIEYPYQCSFFSYG